MLFLGLLFQVDAGGQGITTFDLFQLKEDDVYWQCTYKFTGAPEDLRPQVVQMLKSKFFTFNVIRNETGYNGEIRHYQVDCKRYGRTYLNTPRMYWDGEWTGKFVVDLLDDGYKVTVYALYYEKMEQSKGGYYRNEKVVKGRFVDAVTRNSRKDFRKGELGNLTLISQSLKDNFDYRNTVELPGGRK